MDAAPDRGGHVELAVPAVVAQNVRDVAGVAAERAEPGEQRCPLRSAACAADVRLRVGCEDRVFPGSADSLSEHLPVVSMPAMPSKSELLVGCYQLAAGLRHLCHP